LASLSSSEVLGLPGFLRVLPVLAEVFVMVVAKDIRWSVEIWVVR
jgi:hypothetical protein